jgi:hypothetical protein
MVESVVHAMYVRGRQGWVTPQELSLWTRLPSDTLRGVLEDLRLLKVIVGEGGGARMTPRWMLAEGMLEIMEPLGLYTRERVMADG